MLFFWSLSKSDKMHKKTYWIASRSEAEWEDIGEDRGNIRKWAVGYTWDCELRGWWEGDPGGAGEGAPWGARYGDQGGAREDGPGGVGEGDKWGARLGDQGGVGECDPGYGGVCGSRCDWGNYKFDLGTFFF